MGLIYIFVIGIRLYALGPISEEEVLFPCALPLDSDNNEENIITPFLGSLEDTAGEEINLDEPPLEESRPFPSLPATAPENRPDLEKVTAQSVGTSPKMVEGNYSTLGSLEDTAGEEINLDEPPLEESRPLPSLSATAPENRPDLEKVTAQSVGTFPKMVEGMVLSTRTSQDSGLTENSGMVTIAGETGSGQPSSTWGSSKSYVKNPDSEKPVTPSAEGQTHSKPPEVSRDVHQDLPSSNPITEKSSRSSGASRVNISERPSENTRLPEGTEIIPDHLPGKEEILILGSLDEKERSQNTGERTFPCGSSPVRESSGQVNYISGNRSLPRYTVYSGFRHSVDISVNSQRREQVPVVTFSWFLPDSNSPQVFPPEEAITASLEKIPPGEMRALVVRSLERIISRESDENQSDIERESLQEVVISGHERSVFGIKFDFDIDLEQEYYRAVIINNFVTGIKVFTNLEFSGSFKRGYRKITQELWKFYTPRDIAKEIWKKLQLDDSMDNVRIKLVIPDSQGLANKIFILISALLIFSLTLGYVLGRSYGVLKREPLSYQFREFL